jgi:hypothetical protein
MASGPGFVIAAFVATWIVVLGYLIRLHFVVKNSRRMYEEAGGSQ